MASGGVDVGMESLSIRVTAAASAAPAAHDAELGNDDDDG